MKTVGMITIGQAPRDDLMPQYQALLGDGFRIAQAGALDGLSNAEVAGLAPQPGQHPLITPLRDGSEVVIAKQAILDRLQGCLDRLRGQADLYAILCAGTFPRFRTDKMMLEPDRILVSATQAVFAGGTLGVLIPLADQAESAAKRWSAISPRLAIEPASPYHGVEALRPAVARLKQAGVSLIVMNCMDFTLPMKQEVQALSGVPALLPSSLLARFIAEVA